MLLIYPPMAKACEPPAGITLLAGVLRNNGLPCTMHDANLEGQLHLLNNCPDRDDTWSRRAIRDLGKNLEALRTPELYENPARYLRAVNDLNRVIEISGKAKNLDLSLVNYQELELSPLKSADLRRSADNPEKNIFYEYFSERLVRYISQGTPPLIGISLNYLSQALTAFAMIGFLKREYPSIPIAVGGGLMTSWLSNPAWVDPFGELIDHSIAGPGETPLLKLLAEGPAKKPATPDLTGLPLNDYLSPGLIIPYAASSGCYWRKCSFCPEKAECNPYNALEASDVLSQVKKLKESARPTLLHFLDNAISPALLRALIDEPPGLDWYSFARATAELDDPQFCQALRRSGCIMLKLGLESGDQGVLDAMDKGTDLAIVSRVLHNLKAAGIATYVYLLFGTPPETLQEARRTLDFTVKHSEAITFLNLAIFNMPINSPDASGLAISDFYEGDLSLYTNFRHPQGFGRKEVRRFLDREFKRHPAIAPIIQRDPPFFTSNHAPFFCG
jgi:radical SAM superfamily enzyme YgiQ (UPF0313 family)